MSIFGLFEPRSIENPSVPLSSNQLLTLLGGQTTDSGITVTEESSLAMSAVWRATTLISSLGGALPLGIYDEKNARTASQLLDNPHPEMTSYDLWKLSYVHRCLWGNSYQQKIRDNMRRVQWLYPMSPWRMKVGKAKKPAEGNPTGKVFEYTDDEGKKIPFTPNEVLHVPAMGYDGVTGLSPIRAATQAVGLALAAEKSAAKLFGSGNLLSGILQTEQRLSQEQADTLQERWRSKFQGVDRAYEVAVLDSGAEFQSMTMPNSDAQMLESRDFSITELSRFFGVPPYLMFQTAKSTSWGTGLEQQATGFFKFDLHPQWLAPTEQRITKELLVQQGKRAKYIVEGLLRGDTASRAEFYRTMREMGILTANEIRELEDRTPIEGGDMALQPANMLPLGTDAAQMQADALKAKAATSSGSGSSPKPSGGKK